MPSSASPKSTTASSFANRRASCRVRLQQHKRESTERIALGGCVRALRYNSLRLNFPPPDAALSSLVDAMNLSMLKCKLHQAVVTHAELAYDGSCAIDQDLLDAAGILPYERIEIYDIDNGERFATYALEGQRGSRLISMNGAAARKVAVGDRIIICAYAEMAVEAARRHKPRLVYLDATNTIVRTSENIPMQTAY